LRQSLNGKLEESKLEQAQKATRKLIKKLKEFKNELNQLDTQAAWKPLDGVLYARRTLNWQQVEN